MQPSTTKQLDEIECPNCGTPIPVSKTLRHQLIQHVREELSGREKGLAAKEQALNDREQQLGERTKEIEQRVAKEVAATVAVREAEVQKRAHEELARERKKLEAEAKQRAEAAVSVEMKDVQERLREKEEQLGKAEQSVRFALQATTSIIGSSGLGRWSSGAPPPCRQREGGNAVRPCRPHR